MQHLEKTGVEAPRSGNWPLATLQSPLDSNPFFSHSCALFCTFLHRRKTQPVSFQSIPHSLPKNSRGGGTPSQSNNHCFNKRRRPSRSDGGCCEKGAPSSGEKIVCRPSYGRQERRAFYARQELRR